MANGDGNHPTIIPTKKPGEVYLPALGKMFQLIELKDHWLRFPPERMAEGAGFVLPYAHEPSPGRFMMRLEPGQEMAITTLLYFHTGTPSPGELKVQINRREQQFPREVLKHASSTHLPEGFNWPTWSDENKPPQLPPQRFGEEDQMDKWVIISQFMHKILNVQQQGFRRSVPWQLKDDDDLFVEGLDGGSLFIGGIVKVALGR